jgi:hypothetical protein
MARLRRLSSGAVLALAVNALLALTALGIAFGAPGAGGRPELELAAAGGSLELVNSKDGEAIFTTGAMRPGQQAIGTVQIANGGSMPGALAVTRTAGATEIPGAGGGLLSTRLELGVFDVTQGTAPVQLWSGKLAAMPALGVGMLPAGEQRVYRFVATMPSGAADDAFQGASLSVGFTWTAVGSGEPTGTPTSTPTATPTSTPTATPTSTPTATPTSTPTATPTSTPTATPTSTPPATPTATPTTTPSATPTASPTPSATATPTTPSTPLAGGGITPPAEDATGAVLGAQLFPMGDPNICLSRRKFTITIRRPRGTAFQSLTISVNRKTKLKLTGPKARKVKARISLRGLPKGKVVVKIAAVTTTGKKAVSTRTYKTCAKKTVKKSKKKKRKR